MAWTEDKVSLLKDLWSKGLSASQISNKMDGVTRNAVIGKVHRLGLSWRATPTKPQRMSATKKIETSRNKNNQRDLSRSNGLSNLVETSLSETHKLFSYNKSEKGLISLVDLDKSMCKWPIGDPTKDDFSFCGKKSLIGKSYCQKHFSVAVYNTPSNNKNEDSNKEDTGSARKKA